MPQSADLTARWAPRREIHPLNTCTETQPRERSLYLGRGVPSSGSADALSASPVPWRISPQPFPLRPQTIARLQVLGRDLLAFYHAANRLHLSAMRGHLPAWVLDYLDRGKTERALELGNLRRTRSHVPRIIRPDLMAMEDGTLYATELDTVPGGFGALAALTRRYADLGYDPVGGAEGIPLALAAMFRDVAELDSPTVARLG